MNKSALASLGVIGACAACCTIPIAFPLVSGLWVAAAASIFSDTWNATGGVVALLAGIAVATLAAVGVSWQRRRKAEAASAASSRSPLTAAGCGCSPADAKTPRRC
jgi:hypothetical protein